MRLMTPRINLLPLLLVFFAYVQCWAVPGEKAHVQGSDAEALSQTVAPTEQSPMEPSPPTTSSSKPQSKNQKSTSPTRTFEPSEQISEDFSVPFPVDI